MKRPIAGNLRRSLAAIAPALLALTACHGTPPRPFVAEGHVVAEGWFRDGMISVDAVTGKKTATIPTDGWDDCPPIAKGMVFSHGLYGVVARDVTTGKIRWRTLVQSPYLTSVVAGDSSVFVPSTGDGKRQWIGLDLAKGQPTFNVPADRWTRIATSGELVFSIVRGRLRASGPPDGKQRWISHDDVDGPILAGGSRVLARSDEEEAAVYEASSGELLRRVQLGTSEPFGTSLSRTLRMSFDGKSIAFTDDGTVALASVSGSKRVWTSNDIGARSVVISKDLVIAATDDDHLVALEASTGAKRWDASIEEAGLASFSAGEGVVVVRDWDDHLQIFDQVTGAKRFSVPLADPEASAESPAAGPP